MQNLAQRPDAAASAQESAQAGQNLSSSNLGFNAAQQTGLASILGSQLTQGPDQQTRQAYTQRIMAARSAGLIDDSHVRSAIANMPPDGSPPQAFQQFGTKLLIGALAGPVVAQQAFGNQIINNTGQGVQGGVQASPVMGGALNMQGPVLPTGLVSASQAAGQMPTVTLGPNGVPIPTSTTTADILARQGYRNALPPQFQGGPGAAPATTGRYPVTPPGTAVTGVPVGTAEAAKTTAEAGARQGVDLGVAADQAPTRKAVFDTMSSDLQNNNTGPTASWEKTASALSIRLTGLGITMSPKQVADMESFDKLAKQLALAQSSSLGASTDQRLTTSMGANPNSELTKMGNQQLIGMLKGNEDAIAMKNMVWQNYKQTNGAQSYGDFSNQFNRGFDPRALQAVYMNPADKAKLNASLNTDPLAKAKFVNTLKMGIAAGIIPAPGSAGGR
jgi:hypothetical protein